MTPKKDESKSTPDASQSLGMVINADGTVSEPVATTFGWQQVAGGGAANFDPTAIPITPVLIGPAAAPARILIHASLLIAATSNGSNTYRVRLFNPSGVLVASGSRTNPFMVSGFDSKAFDVLVAELNVDKSKLTAGNYQVTIERTGGTGGAVASNAQVSVAIVG